jgi:hypothetical protein
MSPPRTRLTVSPWRRLRIEATLRESHEGIKARGGMTNPSTRPQPRSDALMQSFNASSPRNAMRPSVALFHDEGGAAA